MEDHGATGGDRVSAGRGGRRRDHSVYHPDRTVAAVDLGDFHHLYRVGLFPRRHSSPHRRGWGMKVKYFAWVRERVGMAEETVEPPPSVRTVDDLMRWLAKRGEAYAHAFET